MKRTRKSAALRCTIPTTTPGTLEIIAYPVLALALWQIAAWIVRYYV